MNAHDLLQGAAVVVPGFITIKLFSLFGAQRPRLEWEWVAWSVVLSLVIDAATVRWGVPWLVSHQVDASVADVGCRLSMALTIAIAFIGSWRLLKRSHWDWAASLRRSMTDSAWDEVLDDAANNGRRVEVVIKQDGAEASYVGGLAAFGREDANSERWVYLTQLERPDSDGALVPIEDAHGLLVHHDQIRRIWIHEGGDEQEPHRTATPSEEDNVVAASPVQLE